MDYTWMTFCAGNIPNKPALPVTVDTWRTEFLVYFTTGGISTARQRHWGC